MDGLVENPIHHLHEMNAPDACYHCGNEITANTHLNAELGGGVRSFCCPGCMAIARTIHGEGLEVFYVRRVPGDRPDLENLGAAIPERLLPYDDPLLLERFTKPIGGMHLETTLKLEIRKLYPLRLGVAVFLNPGKSGPGKGTVPTNKGDWDNYFKAVADCLVYYKFLPGDNANILRGPDSVWLPDWNPDSSKLESGVYPATFSPIGECVVFTLWID
jgi:hypothetical protein